MLDSSSLWTIEKGWFNTASLLNRFSRYVNPAVSRTWNPTVNDPVTTTNPTIAVCSTKILAMLRCSSPIINNLSATNASATSTMSATEFVCVSLSSPVDATFCHITVEGADQVRSTSTCSSSINVNRFYSRRLVEIFGTFCLGSKNMIKVTDFTACGHLWYRYGINSRYSYLRTSACLGGPTY